MIERLIEHWLDSAKETSFQAPFCQMLTSQGYRVVHLTRHCGMELGKDIIAEKDSTTFVYQLKSSSGPRITLSNWRDISSQVLDMVIGHVDHPGLSAASKKKQHRSFLVTNRYIDEEVQAQIASLNRKWEIQELPYKLEFIERPDFLKGALELGKDLWPSELELADTKLLLDLLLEDSRGPLPKAKVSSLLLTVLPLGDQKQPSQSDCRRRLCSAALLLSIATGQFAQSENHTALLDAWGLYAGYVLAVAERWKLPEKQWKSIYSLARMIIGATLDRLTEELRGRENLLEGDLLYDRHFRHVRVTRLLAAVSLHALWHTKEGDGEQHREFAHEFCKMHIHEIGLWGEGAVPMFLLFYWFWRSVEPKADALLVGMVEAICRCNSYKANKINALASPYYSESQVLSHRLRGKKIREDFRRHSYTLEGLVQLLARRLWKNALVRSWADITRIGFCHVELDSEWEFFLWRRRNGVHCSRLPEFPKRWPKLLEESNECEGTAVPRIIKNDPLMLALILCVLPQRLTPSVTRWLDTKLSDLGQESA